MDFNDNLHTYVCRFAPYCSIFALVFLEKGAGVIVIRVTSVLDIGEAECWHRAHTHKYTMSE